MIRILGLKLINILTSGDETEEISLPLFLISAFKCYDLKQVDVNSTSDERRALFVPFEHYKYKKTWLIWSKKKKNSEIFLYNFFAWPTRIHQKYK